MYTSSNLPDPDKCKTQLVCDDLWYCLTHNASRCRHVIGLGNEYYCDHHERHSFKIKDHSRENSNYGL
jgi:hypothetical protein